MNNKIIDLKLTIVEYIYYETNNFHIISILFKYYIASDFHIILNIILRIMHSIIFSYYFK